MLANIKSRIGSARRSIQQADYSRLKDPEEWAALNERILSHIRALPHSRLLTGQTDEN